MILGFDCSIEIDPETNAVSLRGDIIGQAHEAGKDAFIMKYVEECDDYINSLHTTEEDAMERFNAFVEQKVENGTHLFIVPVKTKIDGFPKALVLFEKGIKNNNNNKIFDLIKQHFTYDETCFQELDAAINNDPNFNSAMFSYISEPNKPEFLICAVFSFTF